ncbi:MAG: ABC transporter permease [Chlamydiia bacterium]|nr:ABC transporter permease [Chlamydiia bacterium]
MFELQIAFRYLIPKRRSLSTALISVVSILVISLVIWLSLVFLSVTGGMEKNWLQKLTSLHAPIRISPTDAYYRSYFYQIDSIAAASGFTFKTIGEKNETLISDPYCEESDWEIPSSWQKKVVKDDGTLLDPVKAAFQELTTLKEKIPNLSFQDYEIGGALLRLTIYPQGKRGAPSYLSQMTYLLSWMDANPNLSSLIYEKESEESSNSSDIPIFLPKSYRENGALVGTRGTLSFSSPIATSSQEQRIWIRVAGFYDPGIAVVGNRSILVPPQVTRSISAGNPAFSPDGTPTNGIFAWVPDLKEVNPIADQIREKFIQAGIDSYWKIETYEDFEFAKDLMHQFQSDRTLLLLIASIILVVACSNIISLLVLLVNDRKKEIAILQSMGATSFSIASIFAFCGVFMGVMGCFLGTFAALFTLRNIDILVAFLSKIQGRAAFHPAFFGNSLPNQLDPSALLFILIATPLLSLAAGLVPAMKASRIHPSKTLRSE